MEWTFTGKIERFDGAGGWYHVDVPDDIADEFEHDGFIPITVTIRRR